MKKDKILKIINQKIPCKKGCSDCCGIVPFSKEEFNNIPMELKSGIAFDDMGDQILPLPKSGLSCPFLVNNNSKKQCGIYEYRPLICRAFGRVKNLRCPHGSNIIKPLKDKHMQHLMEKLNYPKPNKDLQNTIRNLIK